MFGTFEVTDSTIDVTRPSLFNATVHGFAHLTDTNGPSSKGSDSSTRRCQSRLPCDGSYFRNDRGGLEGYVTHTGRCMSQLSTEDRSMFNGFMECLACLSSIPSKKKPLYNLYVHVILFQDQVLGVLMVVLVVVLEFARPSPLAVDETQCPTMPPCPRFFSF
jgi:hypothetical protein